MLLLVIEASDDVIVSMKRGILGHVTPCAFTLGLLNSDLRALVPPPPHVLLYYTARPAPAPSRRWPPSFWSQDCWVRTPDWLGFTGLWLE